MDVIERNKEAVRKFVGGMGGDFAGAIDAAMADDCRIVTMGTTAISGERTKAQALQAAALVGQIFPGGLPAHGHPFDDRRGRPRGGGSRILRHPCLGQAL